MQGAYYQEASFYQGWDCQEPVGCGPGLAAPGLSLDAVLYRVHLVCAPRGSLYIDGLVQSAQLPSGREMITPVDLIGRLRCREVKGLTQIC